VTLYEPRGEYQLNVESLRAAGQGRLYEEFLRLRQRLGDEGLFDPARRRPVPSLPHAVGVMTSLRAAALRDVLSTLQRRAPYCRVVVYPVPVQGDGAAQAIAAGLARASARAEVEVLLLVRGGGSIEDLWAFNEETVARAIKACRIPVVVGVGHESDFTIADFAADLRAPTPTAAAEVAARDATALAGELGGLAGRLRTALRARSERWQQRVDYAQRTLSAPRAPLAALRARVGQLALRAARVPSGRVADGRIALARCLGRLRRAAPDWAGGRREAGDRIARIASRCAAGLAVGRARTERLAAELAHLDPQAVLGRGYSIVRDERGRIVVSGTQLRVGQAVQLVLSRGGAAARVESVSPGEQDRES